MDIRDPKACAHPAEGISLVRTEFARQPWARSTCPRKKLGSAPESVLPEFTCLEFCFRGGNKQLTPLEGLYAVHKP